VYVSQVLLLDEITVDLDVVGRAALLDFFIQECDERGCTIVYATHIFDGLEKWISHIAYMEDGQIVKGMYLYLNLELDLKYCLCGEWSDR
jgi:ABC-type uncharacterized transport system ATPase subunit